VKINEFEKNRIAPSSSHQEVEQSSLIHTVEISLVEGLAWVFLEQQLSECKYILGDGVSNIFMLASDGDSSSFRPFPDEHPDYPLLDRSYSLTVFTDLQRINDLASKILIRAAEKQSTFCSGRGSTIIHRVTEHYLEAKTRGLPFSVPIKTNRKRTENGMTTASYSDACNWRYFRYQSTNELNALFETFGPTILIGHRTKRPKVDAPTAVGVGDSVNVVMPSTWDPESFKRRTLD
jgi:hypothetical protein